MPRILIIFTTLMLACLPTQAINAETPEQKEKKAILAVLDAIRKDDAALIKNLFRGNSGDYIKIDMDIGLGITFLDYAADSCAGNAAGALVSLGAHVHEAAKPYERSTLLRAGQACMLDTNLMRVGLTLDAILPRSDPNALWVERDSTQPAILQIWSHCANENISVPGLPTVVKRWYKDARFKPDATTEVGKASIVHVAIGWADSVVCKDLADGLISQSNPSLVEWKDNKGRLPIDYTLGPIEFSLAHGGQIFVECFAYMDPHSEHGLKQLRAGLRRDLLSKGSAQPDVNRACVGANNDDKSPVVVQGTDSDGRYFMWQSVFLRQITDSATTDNPDCADPPGGWSRCAILNFEPLENVFSLTTVPNPTLWIKEANSRSDCAFNPAVGPPSRAGYSKTSSIGWSRISGGGPQTRLGDRFARYRVLAKNWSDKQNRCYGAMVFLGPN